MIPVKCWDVQRQMTGDANVADLAEPFAISQRAVSQYLRVLEEIVLRIQFHDHGGWELSFVRLDRSSRGRGDSYALRTSLKCSTTGSGS